MSDFAIQVDNLSKLYRIGAKEQVHDSLGSSIASFIKSPFSNFRKYRSLYRFDDVLKNPDAEHENVLWALRDLNFELKQGEILGVIGRNGAGKSTLLKILSRITPPTVGTVKVRGKVSSLLEVGTGFHPELTGRENVYLNGTILGMTKRDVRQRFDEIVEFSGVEKFLDTPVKRYSSGMRVRLAFAVAAHLEPEIMIVDEVLAVGDQRFQKKCLNKMQDIGGEGRTVLFVSHKMPAVTRMCSRIIWLDQGQLVDDGPAHDVATRYMGHGAESAAERVWRNPEDAPGTDMARLRAVRVLNDNGEVTLGIDIRQPVVFEMEYDVLQSGYVLIPHHYILNEEGVNLFSTLDLDPKWRGKPRPQGRYVSRVRIPAHTLNTSTLTVNTALLEHETSKVQFHVRDAVSFSVTDSLDGECYRGDFAYNTGGVMAMKFDWDTQLLDAKTDIAV